MNYLHLNSHRMKAVNPAKPREVESLVLKLKQASLSAALAKILRKFVPHSFKGFSGTQSTSEVQLRTSANEL